MRPAEQRPASAQGAVLRPIPVPNNTLMRGKTFVYGQINGNPNKSYVMADSGSPFNLVSVRCVVRYGLINDVRRNETYLIRGVSNIIDLTFEDPTFEDPTFEDPTFENLTFEDPTFEDPTFEDLTFEDPTFVDIPDI
ncbi:hypothetical protein niasHT_018236 [Heterodera trifolii]|uniref:Reverse transcriptase domain-containing protein n=1 Tax=Heterodera trifolii TaxID=157864 RepID=A0ABD2KUU1_9BILA